VTNRSARLLKEIESGVLDQKTPVAALLRKVVILGGQAGSEEMRDWASRELDGYGPEDELPQYRRLNAPLCVDMINMRGKSTGQMITPMHLPKMVRDDITNDVNLTTRISEIEEHARQQQPAKTLKTYPPGVEYAITLMNSDGHQNGQVIDFYWALTPAVFGGVVDAVRTTLTKMVGELRATTPDDADIPSEIATNAMTFAVTGKRNKINFAAAQGSSQTPIPEEKESRRWGRIVATVVAAVVGILLAFAGALFTLMQTQGWEF